MVSRHAVAAQQREVLDIRGGLGLLPVNGIAETDIDGVLTRHAKAQDERLSGRGAPVALFRRKLAHARMELVVLRRREIAVSHPLAEDRLGHLPMDGQALGLPVLLVPSKIEPAQPVEDGIE